MIGVVLCGGQSTRMGKDKGLLTEKGQSWAKAAEQKLASLSLPVVLSVNKNQLLNYATSFDRKQLVVDDYALAVKGPLLGLLSVHQIFPSEDLFVLACDMKDMVAPFLLNLSSSFVNNDCDATVYRTEDGPQPLCGIYSGTGLKEIYTMMQSGDLKKFSMMYVLQTLKTLYISTAKEALPYFKNYNSTEDL